jgi:ribosome maturation factor RimP
VIHSDAQWRPLNNRSIESNPYNRIGIGGPMAASVEIIRRALIDDLTTVGVDLEDLQITTAGRREVVRVVVDRDGGIDLDLIADISRRVAELLDVPPLADEFAGTYVLEVSSPGTDRPLTEEKHWRRAERRLVEATLADDSIVTGRIIRTDAGVVEIEQADGEVRAVPLSSLRRGVVQLEFSRATSDSPDEE